MEMTSRDERLGLVRLSERAYGYLQKDAGLGWSNAGLIAGEEGILLIDTLFDLPLTRRMLEAVETEIGRPVRWVVNTHHNGDHCWGNQLVADATIIGHRGFREEMAKMPPEMMDALMAAPELPPGAEFLKAALEPFDFSGIRPTPPTVLFDKRLSVFVDGREVQLIHVGPAHTSTDVIVFFPEEKVLYAGDIVFRRCTPIGWEGSFENWIAALDLIVELGPETIVPGHGPLCGIEGALEMKAYLEFVRREAEKCFDRGLTEAEAAGKIDLGEYASWTEPERIVFNVARAYREFRGVPTDTPVDFVEMIGMMEEIRRR